MGAEIFRTRPDRPWGPPNLLYSESYPGVKRPGRGANYPPLSSAEGKERVGLYIHSPSGPSWPVIGWTFTFNFTFYLVNNEIYSIFKDMLHNHCFIFQKKKPFI